jgi:tripartite-type tricarboxylate transporter receptor subunit TctC
VYVPAKTPDDVVAKITDALATALTDQAVVTKLAELGAPPAPAADVTPEAHRQKLQEQIDLWAPIIKEAGVTAGG